MSENHWGGTAERARVKGDWLVALPAGLSSRNAMIIGTAGFTAMLCVMALEDAGIRPQDGEVVVTGASGGVGSTAVALLHKLGYQVAAVSGRESTHGYLKSPGANRILSRDEFAESRPLENSCGPVQLIPLAIKCWRKSRTDELWRLRGRLRHGGRLRAADHRYAIHSA